MRAQIYQFRRDHRVTQFRSLDQVINQERLVVLHFDHVIQMQCDRHEPIAIHRLAQFAQAHFLFQNAEPHQCVLDISLQIRGGCDRAHKVHQ